LPVPVAARAGAGRGAGLGAGAVAGAAGLGGGYADLGLGAARRLLQRDLEVVAQVRAAVHAVAIAARAAAGLAENVAEDVAEGFGEGRKAGAARAAHGLFDAGVAVLVVSRALVVVAEDFVGFLRLLEFLLGPLVIRVAVRMVFHGQLAIGLLDDLGVRVPVHTEHFVVIPFRHGFRRFPGSTRTPSLHVP